MMTRKDYVKTADILRKYSLTIHPDVWVNLVEEFSDMFADDNPNYDEKRFVEAVTKR